MNLALLGRLLTGRPRSLMLAAACLAPLSTRSPALAQEAGATAAEPSATTKRWYDMRSLEALALFDPEGVDIRLPLESFQLDQLEPERYDLEYERTPRVEADNVGEIILELLGNDWSDGSVLVDFHQGFLAVEGTEETHAEVRTLLDTLSRSLLSQVSIELYELPAGALNLASGAVLGAEATATLLQSTQPRLVGKKPARIGHRTRLAAPSVRSLLYDYDVEVAQAANVTDPSVSVLHEGLELGALVIEQPNGRLFLRMWGRDSELVGVRRWPMKGLEDAPLQLPEVRSTLCVSSAEVPDGGALVVGNAGRAGASWLVRITRTGPSLSAEASRDLLQVGSLSATPLWIRMPNLPRTQPSGGWNYSDETWKEQLGGTPEPLMSIDDVLGMLWDLRDLATLEGTPVQLGRAFWVRGAPELRGQARALIDELHKSFAGETVDIEVRYDVVNTSEVDTVTAQSLGAGAGRLVGATRMGDSLLVVDGTERMYLIDHDVEIASASSVSDPITRNTFEGVALWTRVTPGPGGTLTAWIDLQVQLDGESEEFPVLRWEALPMYTLNPPERQGPIGSFKLDSSLELRETLRGGLRVMAQLVPGEWAQIGTCAIGAGETSLVAYARMR